MSELVAEQDLRIQELKRQMSQLQSTSSPLNQTTYVYKTLDNANSQPKFFGRESENPINFIKICQRDMVAIGDTLGEADKINFVVRRLKGTAAEWFSVIQDKINTYEDLVKHFSARYWNEEVQRKILVQLEFGKYSNTKGTKETYLIQLISRAKYLEPEITEPDMVNKLEHHFGRGIQTAVITQGIKSLEELLL